MPEAVPHAATSVAPTPEQAIISGLSGVLSGGRCTASFDALAVPVYVTDAEGWLLYHNPACSAFAGRQPVAGTDRWTLLPELRTLDGRPLPHDQSPTAQAIQKRRPIENAIALAHRDDGSRVRFAHKATPVFDEDGRLTGTINLLIAQADTREAETLFAQASRCRRLARSVTDPRTIATLNELAGEYEARASALRG